MGKLLCSVELSKSSDFYYIILMTSTESLNNVWYYIPVNKIKSSYYEVSVYSFLTEKSVVEGHRNFSVKENKYNLSGFPFFMFISSYFTTNLS